MPDFNRPPVTWRVGQAGQAIPHLEAMAMRSVSYQPLRRLLDQSPMVRAWSEKKMFELPETQLRFSPGRSYFWMFFRAANLVIKPIISRCTGVLRSPSSSTE